MEYECPFSECRYHELIHDDYHKPEIKAKLRKCMDCSRTLQMRVAGKGIYFPAQETKHSGFTIDGGN